jgi:hypothetical protein
MTAEHCSKAGASKDFTSSNYGITTNPQREWLIVVGTLQCPRNQMAYGRKIQPISSLVASDGAQRAGLSEVEIIAVVLYTGPMVRLQITHIIQENSRFPVFEEPVKLFLVLKGLLPP